MKEYYGTKRIAAWPEERNGQPGYAVQYSDGYKSWSPQKAFDEAYKPIDAMDFSGALAALKDNKKVCRQGWNGKGMWIELFISQGGMYKSRPLADHIMMATADGKFVPWLASQTDILSSDWMIVE